MTTAYESETCPRCGGSGKFSFNLTDGSRCYGCSGTGYRLTKRGKAALAFFRSLLQRPASEVRVGDNVMESIGMTGPDRWHYVEAVRADTENRVALDLCRGKHRVTRIAPADFLLTSVRTQADLEAAKARALEYQGTLTKSGEVAKRRLAAA